MDRLDEIITCPSFDYERGHPIVYIIPSFDYLEQEDCSIRDVKPYRVVEIYQHFWSVS